MSHFETIHTETIDGFEVVFSVTPETDAPDWDFADDADREDTLARIDRGDLVYFVARVEAKKEGITLGTDYLGGCCYESYKQFVETQDDYYADMAGTAIAEARATIAKLCAA
jgi:hypothetical protein